MTLVYYFGDIQKVPDTQPHLIPHKNHTYRLNRVIFQSHKQENKSNTKGESIEGAKEEERPFIEQVSIGYDYTLFLDTKGLLYGYGDTQAGQLGRVKQMDRPKKEDKEPLEKFQYNTNNYRMAVQVLRQPKEVTGYGSDLAKEIIKEVMSGTHETVVVTHSGRMYCWGKNDQLRNISTTKQDHQLQLHQDEFDIREVSRRMVKQELELSTSHKNTTIHMNRYQHTLLELDDQVYAQDGCAYWNTRGQATTTWKEHYLELERLENQGRSFRVVPTLSGLSLRGISMGLHHLMAWTKEGRLFGWGDNSYGQLGQQSSLSSYCSHYHQPIQIISMANCIVYQAAVGHSYSLILDTQGQLFTLGNVAVLKNPMEIQDDKQRRVYTKSQELSDNSIPMRHSLQHKVVKIKSGGNHHAALTYNGYIYVWGLGINNSNLNMKNKQEQDQEYRPDSPVKTSQSAALTIMGTSDYQKTPRLVDELDRLQVVEFDMADNQTFLCCLPRESLKQARHRARSFQRQMTRDSLSPLKRKHKPLEKYYVGKYFLEFQQFTQSLILGKIKQFRKQQESIDLAEVLEDERSNSGSKRAIKLELSAINGKQDLSKAYVPTRPHDFHEPSLDLMSSRQDTNLIMQYLHQKSILNPSKQPPSLKDQFSSFIEILQNENTAYDKRDKPKLDHIFNHSITSDRNVSLVFDHINTKVSRKKLESLESLRPSEQVLNGAKNKKQKLPYVKDRIQQYLNDLIITQNQEQKYDYIQMVKDSRQDDVLGFIFSDPEVNDIKKKNSRAQALEQRQKIRDLHTEQERQRIQEVETMRSESQRQLQKVLNSSSLKDIQSLQKNIGQSVSYIGIRKELLEFIRERRGEEEQDQDSVLNNLYHSSEYYQLKKHSTLEQQKQLRDFRTNKYYDNRCQQKQQNTLYLQEKGSLLLKYQHRQQKNIKQLGNKNCLVLYSVMCILELVQQIKQAERRRLCSFKRVMDQVIKIQRFTRRNQLATRQKQLSMYQIIIIKQFINRIRYNIKQKKMKKYSSQVAIQMAKLQAKHHIRLGVYRATKAVLVIQRMCRWLNLINNHFLVKLTECFDNHLIALSLATTKNPKANQTLRNQYTRTRDSLAHRFRTISLDDYVHRCKTKSIYATRIDDPLWQYPCFKSAQDITQYTADRSQEGAQKNLSFLQETLLPYTVNNPIRESENTPLVFLPQNLQIHQDSLKEDILRQSIFIETKCKYRLLNSVYLSMISRQKQNFKQYVHQMAQFIRDNSKRIDLHRTKMMLKTSTKQLEIIQQKEKEIRAAQLKDKFRDHHNRPVLVEDHLPFANLKFKIAASLHDAPQLPPLLFHIDYDTFKKDMVVEYHRLFKEKFSQNYHRYKQEIMQRQLNKI